MSNMQNEKFYFVSTHSTSCNILCRYKNFVNYSCFMQYSGSCRYKNFVNYSSFVEYYLKGCKSK